MYEESSVLSFPKRQTYGCRSKKSAYIRGSPNRIEARRNIGF